MKEAGYWTAIIGKYHLNSTPTEETFDYFNTLDESEKYFQPIFNDNGDIAPAPETYICDYITQIAIDVLRTRAR